jgi:hypothetical protein
MRRFDLDPGAHRVLPIGSQCSGRTTLRTNRSGKPITSGPDVKAITLRMGREEAQWRDSQHVVRI